MLLCSGQGDQRQPRAQSGPLGFLLVFALVIAATTLIVALGAGAIGGTQETLDEERAEKAMTQFDSQAALVALGNSQVQRVDLSSGRANSYQVEDDAGRMTLSYTNQTNGNETTIFSKPMGRIRYQTDNGDNIAYQGGGVWRSDGNGNAVMVSPPEFHYRDATLTLPLVTVGSSGTIGDRAVISNAKTTRYFPNGTRNSAYRNPLENARVEVSVTSDYYRAWGEYFETRTDGQVEFNHSANKVTLALVTPLENTKITSATASLSASGTFEINGAAGNLCGANVYTNSYNSTGTDKGYCTQESDGDTTGDGDIVYGGDVDISGGAGGGSGGDLRGDVTSGGKVYVGNGNGSPDIDGNISHTDGCDKCEENDKITGELNQISGIDKAPSINGIVQTQVNESEKSNDNAGAPITDDTLNYTAGSVELSAGRYYLEDITVANEDTVTLNTTEGNIFIGVRENVELAENATIEVVGDGTVSVYVLGDGGHASQLSMAAYSEVTNAGDDAPQFRMFGQDDFTARIGDGGGGTNGLAKYVGVIYAPPGTSGTGTVTLEKGTIYGGVLTGTTTIANGNGGSIHYDMALRTTRVLTQSESIIRVTYIHASTNEIQVEDG
ncbi:DUF7289 family protein [Haloarcula salinisoli]|uniref:DUF7305 domain-containing protein n=1 Tax=Haloarcula salinisoli TaxID=2487746 RepID=A0A8J7YKU4_9EURY|nr:hypothetical protein [Halomicroarcula salinisoli]MBX0303651.1 hypothetical protein [Halomicroarcula salinisoli]